MADRPRAPITWKEARDELAQLIEGPLRREIVETLGTEPLPALRDAMRAHRFTAGGRKVSLRRLVDALDARTRNEGMHVLQAWDFRAHHFSDDIAPVLVLDHCVRQGVPDDRASRAAAILLDNYLAAVLSVLVVRAWDEGDATANLKDLTGLLAALQGAEGSGHRIAERAETLLVLAVSYFHPVESAYDLLLARAKELADESRLQFALASGATLASHLRWGFQYMYRRDVGAMRDDNVADYPWLSWSVSTLAHAVHAALPLGEGDIGASRLAGGLLDALSADPWAFTSATPPVLSAQRSEQVAVREILEGDRSGLMEAFRSQEPSQGAYSPLGFGCNFLSNAAVASVILAVTTGAASRSLDDLFTAVAPAEAFARRLMDYSSHPDRRGAGGAPLVSYSPYEAAHFYNAVARTFEGRS